MVMVSSLEVYEHRTDSYCEHVDWRRKDKLICHRLNN